jgi:hypothetical protein
MRLAYSISGYKLPYQFRWLLSALYNERDVFAVHVDARTPEPAYQEFVAIAGNRPNVVFIEREPVAYMGLALVRAELRAIAVLLELAPDFDYLINLSMQDYPLKPRSDIIAELALTPGRNYLSVESLRQQPVRVRSRPYLTAFEWRGRVIRTPLPRLWPGPPRFRWKGSWWHILTREFCAWLVSDPKPLAYLGYLRNVQAPDELFVQNVLMDSSFADTRADDNRHFVLWPQNSTGPAVLTMADWDQLVVSSMFYARKFDAAVDRVVLTRLADRIGAPVPNDSG